MVDHLRGHLGDYGRLVMAPTTTIDLDAQEVMSPDLVEPLIEPVQDTVLVGSDRVVDGCPVAVREAV